MEAMIVGDTHGNIAAIKAIIEITVEHEYSLMIHLGDFGWWPTTGPNPFVITADEHAKHHNIVLWAIDGNHDFPGLDINDRRGYQSWRYTPENLQEPGLHWIPRNTLLEIDERYVAFIGGAVSIDRLAQERRDTWWHEEMLTDEDVDNARALGEVDILFSHDRLDIPPHFDRIDFSERVLNSVFFQQQRWKEIFSVLKPKTHFHGHFHTKYESRGEEWPGCHTIGLAAENYDSFVGFNFKTWALTHPTFE